MSILRNGRVLTMAGAVYEKGDVCFRGGRIVAVAESIEPEAGEEVIDVSGKWVLPGLVDAHCHIGMWEDSTGEEGADGNEATDPVTPHLRAIDAINPRDRVFQEALEFGVTTVVTGPGSANVLGGQMCAMKTYGKTLDDMVIAPFVQLKAAFGENPKRVYHKQHKQPSTRMATAALIREAFVAAQDYESKLALGEKDPEKMPKRDLKMEALLKALNGEVPLACHAHRADDIATAIRIAKEFGLRLTLIHCTEGYTMTDELKKSGARIILGPLLSERAKVELRSLTFKAPGILAAAGIKFAMATDYPVIPAQYLALCASIAVREGLGEEEALRAITINAAEAAGVDGRVGSLEPGKDADIAVFDGDPLDVRTKASMVIVGGNIAFRGQ